MEIIADLHLHSRFSIATGQAADLEHLDLWGRYKGVQVVGSGDCTHPKWLDELENKLEAVGEGVYGLKAGLSLPLQLKGPCWEEALPVRFVITGEVSAIYKKNGRVRKVHLLLVFPGLEAARRFSQRLGRLGNVAADGRPILGLDAKHLLELGLEIDPASLVIPAHIWTPWFSVLGAKSGFDSLEECFEDSLKHIYALETGLSSDPAMNWRLSQLDRFALVSNSDAHSPQKLGREANIFHVAPTFPDLSQALKTRAGFGGTLEFFPQEGKYHLDGHRKCNLRLTPQESRAWQGLCPVCRKPLTLGVLYRVEELADRPPGEPAPAARPYESLIALPEIVAEVLEVKATTKKAAALYFRLLEKLGPELAILRRESLENLAREGGGLLAQAVAKMRRREVQIAGGYDGVYGEIRLLRPEDRRLSQGQGALWHFRVAETQAAPLVAPPPDPAPEPAAGPCRLPVGGGGDPLLAGLNPAQQAVVTHLGAPLIVQAGPGTGKTRALTHRLAYLMQHRGVQPEEILAVTFTRQAAGEMADRLKLLLPDYPGLERLAIKTFHALGQQLLTAAGELRQVAKEEARLSLVREIAKRRHLALVLLEKHFITWKQQLLYPGLLPPTADPQWAAAYEEYETALAEKGWWDYEDLIARPLLLLQQNPGLLRDWQRFRHILVDEYQDLNEAQYRLFRALAGPEAAIMVIGDPNQAIYGFRGASPAYFHRFREDWPQAVSVRFSQTYRLPAPVLQAAQEVLAQGGQEPEALQPQTVAGKPVVLLEAASARSEAKAIARQIEQLVGGLSHRSLDNLNLRYQGGEEGVSFREVAVLYRFHALGAEIEAALAEAGIPCQQAREGVGPEWEGVDLTADRVKLLTLHAAKGLEFPYVFIAGCEAGLIPWESEKEERRDPAEESRLFYVGLTRAKTQVFLSRARVRSLWGKTARTRLSPLAAAISPEKLLVDAPAATAGRQSGQSLLFPELQAAKTRRGNKP